jgi:CXXC-20-CXXC protein
MHVCTKCSYRFTYRELLKAQAPKGEALKCPKCGIRFQPRNRVLFDTLSYLLACGLAFSLKFLAGPGTKGLILALMLVLFFGGLLAAVLLRPLLLAYEEKPGEAGQP